MTVKAIRLQNFMAFGELAADAAWDEGWVELRPITLLFGRNSSGKSTIIRALRLLQQSLHTCVDGEESERADPFIYTLQDGVDVDSFLNMAHGAEPELYRYRDGESETDTDRIRQIEAAWFEHQGSPKRLVQFEFLIELDREETRDFWSDEEQPYLKTDTFLLSLGYGWFPSLERAGLVSFSISKLFHFESDDTMITLFAADLLPNPTSPKWGKWYFATDLLETHLIPTLINSWTFLETVTAPSFLPYFAVEQGDVGEGIWVDEEEVRKLAETSDDFESIVYLLRSLHGQITQFLQSIVHIPPIRPEPLPYYLLDEAEEARWRRRGLGAYLDAVKDGIVVDSPLGTDIVHWLNQLRLGDSLESKPAKDIRRGAAFYLEITEQSGLKINLAHVGYGASQVIPIIIQSLVLPNALIIIEQPELHLHPHAQARLGDLLIQLSKEDNRFLIETHSEALLRRMRRRVAETTANMVDNTALQLTDQNICCVFIDRQERLSISFVQLIRITDSGDYSPIPGGFRDFFTNDEDAIKLSQARRAARQGASSV